MPRHSTDETLAVVWDKLAADSVLEECTCIPINNLRERLTFCTETTNFGMESDIYRQEEGLAMGSPLSPVLANIYVVHSISFQTFLYRHLKLS